MVLTPGLSENQKHDTTIWKANKSGVAIHATADCEEFSSKV